MNYNIRTISEEEDSLLQEYLPLVSYQERFGPIR